MNGNSEFSKVKNSNNKSKTILGINAVYHESSASLIVNGTLVAAAEEERFNRKKHGKEATPKDADVLPIHAIFLARLSNLWVKILRLGRI